MIPNSRMGSVIGKQGSKIKEIQDASGARLNASEGMLPGSTEVVILAFVTPVGTETVDFDSAFLAWLGLQTQFTSLPITLETSLSKPKKECRPRPTPATARLALPRVVPPTRVHPMYRDTLILMDPLPRPRITHLNNFRPNKFTSRTILWGALLVRVGVRSMRFVI